MTCYIILILLLFPACSAKQQSGHDNPYHFSVNAQNAVEQFMQKNQGWRLALTQDNRNPYLKDYQERNKDYVPYYANGDFNDDGIVDFALIFIKKNNYGLVWFQGRGKYYLPHWVFKNGELTEIETGGIFAVKNGIWVSSCFDCDNLFVVKWNKTLKRMDIDTK